MCIRDRSAGERPIERQLLRGATATFVCAQACRGAVAAGQAMTKGPGAHSILTVHRLVWPNCCRRVRMKAPRWDGHDNRTGLNRRPPCLCGQPCPAGQRCVSRTALRCPSGKAMLASVRITSAAAWRFWIATTTDGPIFTRRAAVRRRGYSSTPRPRAGRLVSFRARSRHRPM